MDFEELKARILRTFKRRKNGEQMLIPILEYFFVPNRLHDNSILKTLFKDFKEWTFKVYFKQSNLEEI